MCVIAISYPMLWCSWGAETDNIRRTEADMIRNGAAKRSNQRTIGGKKLVNPPDHVTLGELDDRRPKPKIEPRGNGKVKHSP